MERYRLAWIETEGGRNLTSCRLLRATFANDDLRECHGVWGNEHAVVVQRGVGGVAVSLRKAAALCSCTVCRGLSAYSSGWKIPRERQTLCLAPVLHSSDTAGRLGELGRQCLVTPKRCRQRATFHSWRDFAKMQKHREDQIPPLGISPPLLPCSYFSGSVSFLHALAPWLHLALVHCKLLKLKKSSDIQVLWEGKWEGDDERKELTAVIP